MPMLQPSSVPHTRTEIDSIISRGSRPVGLGSGIVQLQATPIHTG